MKRGYKRLLLFCIILITLILFNTFVINILSGYKLVGFLIALLIIFDYIFVIERDRHLYFKDILFEILLFSLAFFIIYYLLGLIVGLAKNTAYYNLMSIKDIIIPLMLGIILKEIFRYNMLSKADGNILCTIVVIVLFILLDTSSTFYYTNFRSQYDVLKFIALSLLPAISKNISYSYITKKLGFKPVVVFDLIFSLYLYVLPLIPNLNEYVMSIIYLLTPILFAFRIVKFFDAKQKNKLSSDYHKIKIKTALLPTLLVLIMVYFYSGYFRFFVVAIATGSMEPNVHKGDVVLVDQKYDYDKVEIGDIVAVKRGSVIVVHRIVKKIKIGDSYYYYTKGDANNNMDDFVIKEDMFVGKVRIKLPYIGYPTVWFNGG